MARHKHTHSHSHTHTHVHMPGHCNQVMTERRKQMCQTKQNNCLANISQFTLQEHYDMTRVHSVHVLQQMLLSKVIILRVSQPVSPESSLRQEAMSLILHAPCFEVLARRGTRDGQRCMVSVGFQSFNTIYCMMN